MFGELSCLYSSVALAPTRRDKTRSSKVKYKTKCAVTFNTYEEPSLCQRKK